MTAADTAVRTAPETRTRSGRVRGVWRGETAVFLGIPFAQPPVGELRFAAPAPPGAWDGVRDATAYGPTTDRIVVPDHTLPESVVPGDATLNVNVFTPALDGGAALPVMVWFHGGGFIVGSPKNDWYEGDAFTRDGVVVVTVDYRLGFDGFGFIDGAPDNRGVLDWIASLEWVHENIAAFGGDPANVTIAGQSAGGGAVLTLLALPAAQHLFRAAISLSGAVGDISRERAENFAATLARTLEVEPTRAGFASVPEERLLERSLAQVGGAGVPLREHVGPIRKIFRGDLPIGPMIDGDLIAAPLVESLATGIGADKPLMIVTTDDEDMQESAGWLPPFVDRIPGRLALRLFGLTRRQTRTFFAAHRGLQTRLLLGRLAADSIFRLLALEVLETRPTSQNWTARVSWPSPLTGDALHCVDMPFFFDVLDQPSTHRMVGTRAPQAIADAFHGSAVRFLRGEAPDWEAWTPRGRAIAVMGVPVRTEHDAYGDTRHLIRRLPAGLAEEARR